jgi:phytoene desaturase
MKPFDAVILGAGVGGMCSASLLANQGLTVAVIERLPRLGGRFSTIDCNGYRCAVGGLAVPFGRDLEEVCQKIGIPSGVKPVSQVAVWLDGTYYDLKDGGTSRIIRDCAPKEEAEKTIAAVNHAMFEQTPSNEITFRDWLNQVTTNPGIHGLFQATIASLFTVNSSELPAGEYFRLIKTISPLTFGYIEGGSITLWERMRKLIEARDGVVLTSASVSKIHIKNGQVTGVDYQQKGKGYHLSTPIVISNLGPSATIEKTGRDYFTKAYVKHIDHCMTPTALLWMHFVSEERLFDYSAISFGGTQRINMIDCPSMEASGLAPEGHHLYTLGAAPLNTFKVDNVNAEFDEVMRDLERIIPDFNKRCTILNRMCYRYKWPGFRTVPGKNPGAETPIAGLYNVGDAACPAGYAGSMGAAKSAQLVCDYILARLNLTTV